VPEDKDYPPTKVIAEKSKPTHNQVEYLWGTPTGGTPPLQQGPASTTTGWQEVLGNQLTGKPDKWVQMHVVSERLGGVGDNKNLIPAPNSVNTGPFLQLELKTHQALASRDSAAANKKIKPVLWYDVKVSWYGGAHQNFPSSISGEAGLYLWKGREIKWKKNTAPLIASSSVIPTPEIQKAGKVSLSFSGKTDLKRVIEQLPVSGSAATLARLIVENRPYGSEADFKARVTEAAKDTQLSNVAGDLNVICGSDKVVLKDVAT
jgi:hypothetical protein